GRAIRREYSGRQLVLLVGRPAMWSRQSRQWPRTSPSPEPPVRGRTFPVKHERVRGAADRLRHKRPIYWPELASHGGSIRTYLGGMMPRPNGAERQQPHLGGFRTVHYISRGCGRMYGISSDYPDA